MLALASCGGQREWSDIAASDNMKSEGPTTSRSITVGGGLAGETLPSEQWERIVADVEPITYKVFNQGCSFTATGSAVAIGPTLLVTNRHVVEGARVLEVQAPGSARLGVRSWRTSKADDLALLELSSAIPDAPLDLGTAPVPGDLVAALGYPLGGDLTAGQGRIVEMDKDGAEAGLLKASMEVLPGNSGGPLIDTRGTLVGVVRAIDLTEGWAIAVPVERVRALLDDKNALNASPC